MCAYSPTQRHTTEDLYNDEKGARARARAAQAEYERQQEGCTFKPALDPNSLALASQRRQRGAPSLLDRIDQDTSAKVRKGLLCVICCNRSDDLLLTFSTNQFIIAHLSSLIGVIPILL